MSHLLEEYQLNFDDPSPSTTPTEGVLPPKIILEPKHEKRDSGIAGLEESSEPLKILEDGDEGVNVLQTVSAESAPTTEREEEEDEDDEGDATDEEGKITHIDEVQ